MATKSNPSEDAAGRDFVITRVLDAPRELVFKAWVDPELMAQWWGPHTFTNPVCTLDVQPGGAYRIVMRGPDGVDYPLKGVYREVARPERLVMTVDCSEHPDAWHDLVNPNRDKSMGRPTLDMLQTVTFENLEHATRLTVSIRFASAATRDALVKIGMNEGWSQSLDRLAAEVAKLAAESTSRGS